MGFAEHPYRELAAISLKHGLTDEYEKYLTQAHKVGMEAGQEHIDSLQRSIDDIRHDHNKDPLTANNGETLSGPMISKSDFLDFANSVDYSNSRSSNSHYTGKTNPNAVMAGLAWGALTKTANPRWGESMLSAIPEITKLGEYSFESMVKLMDEVQDIRVNNPRVHIPDIFGSPGVGEKTVKFIQDFVEYKKQQLAQTEQLEA